MLKKFNFDINFELQKEIELLPMLKTYFNDETINRLGKNNVFDYIGNNKYIKLKSRSNNCNKYPTTMRGYNKIIKAPTLIEDVYFVFCFIDYLYYYKYDKDQELEVKYNHCSRIERGKPEIKTYCFIPIVLLQKIILKYYKNIFKL